ncbi:MAG: portal protein, partial [Bacteroidales bacterium]|nr:portal protein [Bacteroidales bacterium]
KERVDMIYRACELTAYQAYNKFGKDNVGESIKKAVETEKEFDKPYEFVHYVGPRHKFNPKKKDSKNLPFFSYWVSVADNKIVKEGGYEEFPFFVTRFYKNSSEAYGYSAAFVSLPDILMLNKMMKTYIEGAEISIYPAWLLESDSIIGTLDLRAAAINYQRSPLSQGVAAQSLAPKMNAQVAIDFINRTENNIKAAFFTDLFLMLTQNVNMTATEVIERTQEKMLMLGPVLGRLQSELLSPKLKRTFSILFRRKKLPPLPEKLKGQEYDIVYISPLAKAQRAVQAKDMTTFMSLVVQMAGMVPDVLDNVDTDEMVQRLSKIYSVDPEVIRDDETRDIIRNQRAKMQEQEMRLQLLERASGIGKTIKEATPDDRQAARSVS